MSLPLFETEPLPPEVIDDGVVLLRGFAAEQAQRWVDAVQSIQAQAGFRLMQVPGGKTMSVAISNCGDWGWVSDLQGYRYSATDPLSGAHGLPCPHFCSSRRPGPQRKRAMAASRQMPA